MAHDASKPRIHRRALLVASAVALLTGTLLSGCASSPASYSTPSYHPGPGALENTLYQQYRQWKGVRYELGGLSKQGVDCSGFVYLTFMNKLGRKLPRTTAKQSRTGTRVEKHELQPGDLVFFRTENKIRHVGIYLDDGQFLHASTSEGVTISSLGNQYWQQNYWQARRVRI